MQSGLMSSELYCKIKNLKILRVNLHGTLLPHPIKEASNETPIREKRIISSVTSGTASTAEKLRSANPYVWLFRRKQHLLGPARRALKKANLPGHVCTFAQTSQQLFADVLRYT